MKSSVCLLTAYNSGHKPLADITVPYMRLFAQAHGYQIRIVQKDDWERGRGWIKVEAIRPMLDGTFDFVFWIDVDAVIQRSDVDIRSAIADGADLHMVWHGPDTSTIEVDNFVPHFNTGVMLIRATEWSRDFFEKVWEVGQLPHHWSDQATILHLLGYDSCIALGLDRPDEPNRSRIARIDTIWNSAPGLATATDPIIHHYAGISNPSTRLRLIKADAQIVPLRETAGLELRRVIDHQLSLWRDDTTMRDWVTGERDAALAERDAALAERNAALAERNAARAELEVLLTELELARSYIQALRASRSWKLTAPLRWVSELRLRLQKEN